MANSPNGSEETFILRHRHRYERGFTIIDNLLLQDTKRLSYRAIGVMAHLWSLPDGAPMTSGELAAKGKEGRDAVRAALNELAAAGYIQRERRSEGRGRWVHIVTLADQPVLGKDAGQITDGLSVPDRPTVGGPGAKNVKDSSKDTSPNGDGGTASKRDGRADTIVGKGIETLGIRPVEIGAFSKILTDAVANGVPESIILKAVRHWGDGANPVSWLTGEIGTLHREAVARTRRGADRNGTPNRGSQHDGQHDPTCWCAAQGTSAPPGGVLANLARVGQSPEDVAAQIAAEDAEARARGACCASHTRACEPPSELCCEHCPEVRHPDHPDGEPCVLGVTAE